MFTPEERQIFRYFNGKRVVAADPMEIYRKLLQEQANQEEDLENLLKLMREGVENQQELIKQGKGYDKTIELFMLDLSARVMELVHAAFGTKPLTEDEEGLTQDEAMKNFREFRQFQDEQAKKREASRSISPSTDGPPEATEAQGEASTTQPTAA